MNFEAHFDRTAQSVTILGCMGIAFAYLVLMRMTGENLPLYVRIIMVTILIIAIGLPWMFSPKYYSVSAEGISVYFRFFTKKIKMAEIEEIFTEPDFSFGAFRKISGSWAFFGYWGTYRYKNGAKITSLSNRKDDLVIVKTPKSFIALGPENTTSFIRTIKEFKDAM